MAEFYSRWDLRRNLVIKLILFLSGPETPFPLGVFTNAGLHHAIGQWWIWGPDGRMADAGPVTQAPNTRWWPPLHHVRSSLDEMLLLGCAYAKLCFPKKKPVLSFSTLKRVCIYTFYPYELQTHNAKKSLSICYFMLTIFYHCKKYKKNINISLHISASTVDSGK